MNRRNNLLKTPSGSLIDPSEIAGIEYFATQVSTGIRPPCSASEEEFETWIMKPVLTVYSTKISAVLKGSGRQIEIGTDYREVKSCKDKPDVILRESTWAEDWVAENFSTHETGLDKPNTIN